MILIFWDPKNFTFSLEFVKVFSITFLRTIFITKYQLFLKKLHYCLVIQCNLFTWISLYLCYVIKWCTKSDLMKTFFPSWKWTKLQVPLNLTKKPRRRRNKYRTMLHLFLFIWIIQEGLFLIFFEFSQSRWNKFLEKIHLYEKLSKTCDESLTV